LFYLELLYIKNLYDVIYDTENALYIT
jgi:hypothetical protein